MTSITSTALTSELDAINLMLEAVGETPIEESQINSNTLTYVVKARSILTQVNREVQSVGWHFNTEHDYPLTRNADNQLVLPANTLRADTSKIENYKDVVQRGVFLYDRENRVYTFDADVKLDMVILLPFCNLPEYARFYIALRAARRLHDRTLTSDKLHMYTEQDEMGALAIMQEADGDTGDYNMLSDSYSVSCILERW